MKVLYAVQATGNGHISRLKEIYPVLSKFCDVDVFMSGSNFGLNYDFPVKFRSRGLSLFYNDYGGLDYMKILRRFTPLATYGEAKDLPVEKYDAVINDFEPITALACRLKKVHSIGFGHQASFAISDKVPRPTKRSFVGEFILNNYASSTTNIGLHFSSYDAKIFTPIIRQSIFSADVKDKGHITVYLPQYSDYEIKKALIGWCWKTQGLRFEVFSKEVKEKTEYKEGMTFIPIGTEAFDESFINCTGIITGAGFETPAEALFMGKRLICIPIKGQYEQLCNAEALKMFHVPIFENIDELSINLVDLLYSKNMQPIKLILAYNTDRIIREVMQQIYIHSFLSSAKRQTSIFNQK